MTLLEDIQSGKPSRFAWFWNMFRRDKGVHIVCDCRPQMTYCNAFSDIAPGDEAIDGTECTECLAVMDDNGCPNCGCFPDQCCAKCCVEGGSCHAQV